MAIRLIQAGYVSPLRSQAIYHGVARAFQPDTPDTIILVSPDAPYVCIGFHQDVEKEVDVAYCREKGLPIIRREVGGGAVYLDSDQLFTQWVLHPQRVPMRIEERFKLHAFPIIATYKQLGIEAYFRPINDIQVAGRKIGGMGAARIGQGEVLVGSLMFDFNFQLMARVLKVPDEKFRDKIYQSLQEYMTTMKRELGEKPSRSEVTEIYLQQCEKAFGDRLEEGELTEQEKETIALVEEEMSSQEWLFGKGTHARPAVKIHSGVWVGETRVKAPGGLMRITLRLKDQHIDDIALRGDFTFYPQRTLEALEKALLGLPVQREAIEQKIQQFYQEHDIQSPGVSPKDWANAIVTLAEEIAKN